MRSRVLAQSRLHFRYPSRPYEAFGLDSKEPKPCSANNQRANRTQPQPMPCEEKYSTSTTVLHVWFGLVGVDRSLRYSERVGAVRGISMFTVFRPGVRDVCVGPQMQNAGTLEGAREEVAKLDVVLE